MTSKMAPEKLSSEKIHYQYSLLQKLFYFIVGFPPRPQPLPDETWEKWKNRFKQPEYDWTRHSGKNDGQRP